MQRLMNYTHPITILAAILAVSLAIVVAAIVIALVFATMYLLLLTYIVHLVCEAMSKEGRRHQLPLPSEPAPQVPIPQEMLDKPEQTFENWHQEVLQAAAKAEKVISQEPATAGMARAIEAVVIGGQSVRQAAKEYGVAESTLRRKIKQSKAVAA